MYRIRRGYKFKMKPMGNPEDPVWQRIVEMEEVRKAAMRRAIETGEPYRDPYEERFRRPN